MSLIHTGDLSPFAEIDGVKAAAMIADAEAMAILAAPCLATLHIAPADETEEAKAIRLGKVAAAKALLRGAIVRWHEAGSGAISQEGVTAGPFGSQQSFDTRVQRKAMFWPSEIEQLQSICSALDSGKAFTLDTVSGGSAHAYWCALTFGALYCSCGADVAGVPIYGGEE